MPRPQKVTNDEILTAARQVFIEQGMSASTSQIAERVGISEAAIFKRFSTKQALFMASMGIDQNPSWVKLLTQQPPDAEMRSRLQEICEQMLAFYQDVFPRLMVLLANRPPPDLGPVLPPQVRDRQLLTDYLERAIAAGYLRTCDTVTVSSMIVGGLVNYVMSRTILSRFPQTSSMPLTPPAEPQQFVSNMLDVIWPGIAPD